MPNPTIENAAGPIRAENTRKRHAKFLEAVEKRKRDGEPVEGYAWDPATGIWRRTAGAVTHPWGINRRDPAYARSVRDGFERRDMVSRGIETRICGPQTLAVEQRGATGRTIVGYGAVFNSVSHNLGGFVEIVLPGAFARSIAAGGDIQCCYNHAEMLGRTTAGTLRVREDDTGLRYELDAPNTTCGLDLMEKIRRGDVTGSSFSFQVDGDSGERWRQGNGQTIRELVRVALYECGPVDSPAYSGTNGLVGLRNLPVESFVRMTRALRTPGHGFRSDAERLRALKLAEVELVTDGTPNRDYARRRLAEIL